MAWTVDADPDAFAAAVLWFLLRTPVTREQWDKLSAESRRKSFTVSGVAKADVILDVFRAIDRALATGTSVADFKKQVGPKLREAWQGTVKNPAWRLETIYRTNMQAAYGAGRWAEMTEPTLAKLRPLGKYDAILDNRVTPRCESLDGTVLTWEEWEKAGLVPPNHFNCRSSIRSLRQSQGAKEAKRSLPVGVKAQEGFGQPPKAAEWEPDLSGYPPDLRKEVEARLHKTPDESMSPPSGATFVEPKAAKHLSS